LSSNTEVERDLLDLVAAARAARAHAYCPYSGFSVGAALRAASGAVYSGCNIENASYGATLCAERAAVACMVASGDRAISAMAIYTEAEPPAMPCGLCRQVLQEFGRGMTIVVASPKSARQTTLAALLPEPFVLT
jgi:cytidine deaminase